MVIWSGGIYLISLSYNLIPWRHITTIPRHATKKLKENPLVRFDGIIFQTTPSGYAISGCENHFHTHVGSAEEVYCAKLL